MKDAIKKPYYADADELDPQIAKLGDIYVACYAEKVPTFEEFLRRVHIGIIRFERFTPSVPLDSLCS